MEESNRESAELIKKYSNVTENPIATGSIADPANLGKESGKIKNRGQLIIVQELVKYAKSL